MYLETKKYGDCQHEFHQTCLTKWISSNAETPSCPVCRNTAIKRKNKEECLFCDLDTTDDEKDEIREIEQKNKIKAMNRDKGKNVVEDCEDEKGSTEIVVYIEDPVFSDKSYEFEVIFKILILKKTFQNWLHNE
uniref:RING-type domain-containing protein n=1 Tax=Meloidogyne enterolobii TaxID=390850 RepID=A0A6V7W8A4_MELEN|nr:unnamed protein product [Meloidogyne enterolobii]